MAFLSVWMHREHLNSVVRVLKHETQTHTQMRTSKQAWPCLVQSWLGCGLIEIYEGGKLCGEQHLSTPPPLFCYARTPAEICPPPPPHSPHPPLLFVFLTYLLWVSAKAIFAKEHKRTCVRRQCLGHIKKKKSQTHILSCPLGGVSQGPTRRRSTICSPNGLASVLASPFYGEQRRLHKIQPYASTKNKCSKCNG